MMFESCGVIQFVTDNKIVEFKAAISNSRTLWIPVLSDRNPESTISFIYIYSVDSEAQYIINFGHNDADILNSNLLFDGTLNYTYVYGYKLLRSRLQNSIDICMAAWYYTNSAITIDFDDKLVSLYKTWYPDVVNLCDAVPIYKLIEWCQVVRDRLLFVFEYDLDAVGLRLYQEYLDAILDIEDSGIYIDASGTGNFKVVHPSINVYTTTGRAVSKVSKITLNSLPHGPVRSIIRSRFSNGRLVEFDYDSYHIRLAASLLGYPLPTGNLHEYFGSIYFKTPELTDEQYNQSKRITFRQLYGDVEPEYLSIQFFKNIQSYKETLYSDFCRNGYVTTPLSNRKIYDTWYVDMTPSKLFSYIIQMTEVETNINTLRMILHYLYNRQSKLILYSYDAFLIDYNLDDGADLIENIKRVVTKQFPCKVYVGKDYGNMVLVT